MPKTVQKTSVMVKPLEYKTLSGVSEIKISDNAKKIFERRYLLKDEDGKPVEKIEEAFMRVANHVANGEKSQKLRDEYTDHFYKLMTSLRFVPNSPTWTGAKTPLGQLAACFVLPLEDDMGSKPGGIFDTLKNAALIQQTGGGNGFSFSRLRPKGARVKSSNGVASGPVSFLAAYDAAFGHISQGGTRRGANMAVLRVDHPDIREFIKCKSSEGSISNFNISVGITDKFMEALKNEGDFDLINPKDGKVWETVKAKELFDEILKYAFQNGEPGCLFLDPANRENPVPNQYTLEATNPCVTGDTFIYTSEGLQRAKELAEVGNSNNVVVDGRLSTDATKKSSPIYYTGNKDVYKLTTKEGFQIKATSKHKIMTEKGWIELGKLAVGDKINILNHKGGFGFFGNSSFGKVLGWLFGDGTFNIAQSAGLMFFGTEQNLAPVFAEYVSELVVGVGSMAKVGVMTIPSRSESRVVSSRLKNKLNSLNIKDKENIPEIIYTGNEDMQRGFLQALFSADGTVLGNPTKGINVRLWSNNSEILNGVQKLLINFGIFSKIYLNRKEAFDKLMPDGKGSLKSYKVKAGHELVISKQNVLAFKNEIGFLQEEKNSKLRSAIQALSKRGFYTENFTAAIKSIEYAGNEAVYDLTEPSTHSFIANGIVVHNCGEQWLGPYENCCLGHVNINASVFDGKIDWNHLKETTILGTRFLDNVVTQNAYVPAVPALKEAAHRNRRIGLGYMGLADAMYQLGIRYGSKESFEFASQVTEFIRYHSMMTSIDLAAEKGAFPGIEGSRYDPKDLKWTIPSPLVEHKTDFGRSKVDWNKTEKMLKQHGIRNCTQLTVAPTGTTGTVYDVEGYGCEPVFALAYSRNVYQAAGGEKNMSLTYVSPSFEKALNASSISDDEKKRIIDYAIQKGSIQDLDGIPEEIKKTFVVSADIKPEEHVWMQASIQRFVDNSISKTCNFPENATVEDVKKAYLMAWELGCKGLTVYVTGSRQEVVLETKETKDKKDKTADAMASPVVEQPAPAKRSRPSVVIGRTHEVNTPFGKAFVTVNRNGHMQTDPFEVFVTIGKSGSDAAALAEALGRLISGWLRSSVDPDKTLEEIASQLKGIGGSSSIGFGAQRVASIPDAVAKVLLREISFSKKLDAKEEPNMLLNNGKKELESGEEAKAQINAVFKDALVCPECNNMTLVESEGCIKCHTCAYSRC